MKTDTFLYKYIPEDFEGIMNLADDLSKFYEMLESFKQDGTRKARLLLDNQIELIFFTIKHRELEGAISCQTAEDLRIYLGELLYG